MLQVLLNLKRDLVADRLLRLVRGAGDVRRHHHVLERGERGALGRLVAEHVQRRRCYLSGLEPLRQRGLVHQLTAGAVHQSHAALHLLDGVRVDHARGLRRQADVQGDVIGRGVDLIQAGHADFQIPRHAGRDERIVRNHGHVEGAGALGDFQAHSPQPDDAKRLAAQLGALQRLLLPLAGMHERVGAAQVARHGQHQPQGVLGDRHRVCAGGVHHGDALLGGGFQVDVIHAHAGAADHAELGSGREHARVHLDGGAHDQRVGIHQVGRKFAFDLLGSDQRPAVLIAEQLDCGGGNFLGNHDLHGRDCSAGARGPV